MRDKRATNLGKIICKERRDVYDWRNLFINNMKRGNEKMEVVYNVVFSVKNNEEKTDKEIEDILTKKRDLL